MIVTELLADLRKAISIVHGKALFVEIAGDNLAIEFTERCRKRVPIGPCEFVDLRKAFGGRTYDEAIWGKKPSMETSCPV